MTSNLIKTPKQGESVPHQITDLKRIYAEAPIGLCYFDTNLRYVHINAWLAAINGLEADKHLGRTIGEVLPDVAAGVEPQLREVIESGQALLGGTVEAETAAHPGVKRFYEHNYYPVKSDDGTVVGVSCAVQDVTERRLAQRNLQEAHANLEKRVRGRTRKLEEARDALKVEVSERGRFEDMFRRLLEAAPDAMVIVEGEGQIVLVNGQTEKLLGYSRDELLGKTVEVLLPERFRTRHVEHRSDYSRNPFTRPMGAGLKLFARCKDGREVPVEISLSPLEIEGELVALASIRDVTAREQTEAKLHELGGRLIGSQEDDRRRIARELHDDFNQRLSLLSVELEQASRQLPESPARVRELMQNLSNQTKDISTDVHNLSHRLHPAKLELLGLVAAVKSLCRELSKQEGIRIEFTHREVPISIPEDAALCIYRIVQEALRNVIKHSGTKEARVELTGGGGAIRLQVSDSGVGFEPDSVKASGGLGLVSMQERLRLVGGEFSIQSRPSRGTRVDIRVPLAATGS